MAAAATPPLGPAAATPVAAPVTPVVLPVDHSLQAALAAMVAGNDENLPPPAVGFLPGVAAASRLCPAPLHGPK
eukprot:7018080-Prorocentrum_lima.AAC.1